jgi:hypothetical protein
VEALDKPDCPDPLIQHFKKVWADNGDAISVHYTGAGSTHTKYNYLYNIVSLEQENAILWAW